MNLVSATSEFISVVTDFITTMLPADLSLSIGACITVVLGLAVWRIVSG